MHARFARTLAGLLACCSAGAVSASVAAAAPTTVAGHTRVAIDSAASAADFSATAGRNGFVVLQEWERGKLAQLKASSPAVKVLMYKNLSFVAATSGGNASTGVTMAEADANPSWYLRNTAGERFSPWSYPWMKAADIGNAGYQQRWADNVLTKLVAQGWDGVFVDDTNPTMRHHYDVASILEYPTDAAYGAATGSAVAAIGPKLQAAGKLVIPNFGDWRMYRSVVDGWLDDVSGGMEEQFTKWGTSTSIGYLPKADWGLQLGAQKVAEAKGKYFIGVSHSARGDVTAARYGWATALLGASGRTSYAMAADYTDEQWFAEYDYPIGEPTDAEVAEPSGVHRRAFSNGLVLVNPTSAPVDVALGGTYSGSGLSEATRVTMAPSSGLVLTRDGAAAPAEAATGTAPASTVEPAAGAIAPTTGAPAPTTGATTTTTTTSPAAAKGPSRRRRARARLRVVLPVQVRRSSATTSLRPVVRRRATCPRSVRRCRVKLRAETRRTGVSRGRARAA